LSSYHKNKINFLTFNTPLAVVFAVVLMAFISVSIHGEMVGIHDRLLLK